MTDEEKEKLKSQEEGVELEADEDEMEVFIDTNVQHIRSATLDIAAMDKSGTLSERRRAVKDQESKKETFYSDLICTLTNLKYNETQARNLWEELLNHKLKMSERMERNVGIRVAAFDYFQNIEGTLGDVKIIDSNTYLETTKLALTDGLTGLLNHRTFQEYLVRDIEKSKDGGEMSLLMVDIDHFKTYNDINGHMAGDIALREVASILRKHVKREDVVARYGGEEFVLIFMGMDKITAREIAERLREVVDTTDFPNQKVLPNKSLTISVGIASYPSDATTREQLISYADAALYSAKHKGRNCVVSELGERRLGGDRLACSMEATITPTDNSSGKINCKVKNISDGGVLIKTDTLLPADSVVDVNIKLSDAFDSEFTSIARIMWVETDDDTTGFLGLKFVKIDDNSSKVQESILHELGAGEE